MAERPRPDVALRVTMDGAVAIGPRQAALLEEIMLTGSISAAQRRLRSSYPYIWRMVATMNENFLPPLVEITRGGKNGGGAALTSQGHRVLVAYRRMERILLAAGGSELAVIAAAARTEGHHRAQS